MSGSVPHLKTDTEHQAFLHGLASLMVRFALDWSATHPGTSFSQALRERTFFVNLGVWHRGEIYDHPELADDGRQAWEAFLEKADQIPRGDRAEVEIMGLLPPVDQYFLPRVRRDQEDLHHPVHGLGGRPGCLWTFASPEALSLPEDPSAPRVLEFHIANHRYPASFLREPDAIRAELRALSLRARGLGFEAIGTRSWLNSLPAWLACFPTVWSERRTPEDENAVGGHLGCWGQVVTARQTLSGHAEGFLRTHKRFEFAMRASWVRVEEILD